MTPELGHLCLILALALALMQGIMPLLGAARDDQRLMAVARPAACGQFALLLLSFCCLSWSFLTNDFSVSYVANHSNTQLPWYYRLTAVWGGHEGSLLLWVLILAGWTAAVALFSRALPEALVARVLGVMGLISVAFLLFTQVTSNPFERVLPFFPLDGRDLNPLLQDPGLIVHPPMLYMGYVGFAVAFAFVVAALMAGQLDSAWARWSRPWTTAAWCFLTLGIALGSWWAYYELGWGGWWFWDPVENASFMPWLVGTALMHSLAATEKRGVFRVWTVLLAISAFSLSILGTFLVRSGVLTSVHAFATDPERGIFLLMILALVTGGALLLLVLRAHAIRSSAQFTPQSREMALFSNNLLLVIACVVVFIGTIYPLVRDVLDLGKLSVGPPYFNTLFAPLTLLLMLVLGVGPLLRWKRHPMGQLLKRLVPLALASLLLGVGLCWWFSGALDPWVVATVTLGLWVVLTSLLDIADKLTHRKAKLAALFSLPRSFVGMILGHWGLVIVAVGVAVTSHYSVERDVKLGQGQTVAVGPYSFYMARIRDYDGPNFRSTKADIEVSAKDGRIVALLHPEKRLYMVQQMPMTEVGIRPGLFQDLYVALGEPLPDGSWAVRVQYKPFVRWLWLGALIMAIGGFIAMADRRYRAAQRVAAPTPASTSVPPTTAGGSAPALPLAPER